MYDVTVLYAVLLPLDIQETALSDGLLRAKSFQVAKFHHLSADKPSFKVGMDDTGRLGGGSPPVHSPGAQLVRTRGEERNPME
jgi:hypothetical protein